MGVCGSSSTSTKNIGSALVDTELQSSFGGLLSRGSPDEAVLCSVSSNFLSHNNLYSFFTAPIKDVVSHQPHTN